MNTRTTFRHAIVSACFVGAVALLAPTADAHSRHHRQPHHGKVRVQRHDRFVPRTVALGYHGPYSSFYSGRMYFPAHRHHHATYRFPVVVDGYVVYRPYAYCDGNLVVRASATLPSLAVDIVFGRDPYAWRADEPYPRYERGAGYRYDPYYRSHDHDYDD